MKKLLLLLPLTLFATSWKDKARVQALRHADFLLYWSLPMPSYNPSEQESFSIQWPELEEFSLNHNYFSLSSPLIGQVSSSPLDLALVEQLLSSATSLKTSPTTFDIALTEILTKVLAYRDLPLGKTLLIPRHTPSGIILETYTVDRIFNLWKGMPAFGLIPSSPNTPSLLLFRGTDFSLLTTRGLASIMSDLDPKGPGLRAFLHARSEIKAWLSSVHSQNKSARALGFSLGGSLATYTFIYFNPLLSDTPSIALCPPGLSPRIIKAFYTLPTSRQSLLHTYINAGDPISQIGKLPNPVYVLSTKDPLRPLTAHTSLLSTKTPLYRLPLK
ncbi:MAG: hypothetical protein RLZZ453_776 [Chlamydiota bacterium]|jgi:hypothetical protein